MVCGSHISFFMRMVLGSAVGENIKYTGSVKIYGYSN
jgi:hypothetical protein